jgi:hypothetical protein
MHGQSSQPPSYAMRNAPLPHRDVDPVLTLDAHYFLPAELMLKNYKKLWAQLTKTGKLSRTARVDLSVYFTTWLGFLGVTAEGYKKLKMHLLLESGRPPEFVELLHASDLVGKQINTHHDALRKFRNDVFHLRESDAEFKNFLYEKPGRLEWAEALHAGFKGVFSQYRVLCQVHYILNDRPSERF